MALSRGRNVRSCDRNVAPHGRWPRYHGLCAWGSIGAMHYALCVLLLALSAAGFHTHAADVMTKMESLGEGLELFVASHVVKVFLSFLDRSSRADRKAVPAGTTILR